MQKKIIDEENTGQDRDYLKGKDLSNVNSFARDRPCLLNEDKDDFKFMQIDVDYYTTKEDMPSKFIFANNFSLEYLQNGTE